MAINKESRLLRVGVLGCGPIAQIAHFDACRKSRNIELHAICDVSDELRSKMAAIWEPSAAYDNYEALLDDPQVEAVIIAVADQFHVPLAIQALNAGKHVLVEKPLGVAVGECLELQQAVRTSGKVLQVGSNRRFDPGMMFAHQFVATEMGPWMAFRAWYHDSTFRYRMTDNLQPVVHQSAARRRPPVDPKADRRRYYLLTHGSHLVDTVRFLCGEIVSVQARLLERFGSYCWFINAAFAQGGLANLDLIIAVQGDFEEGFALYGEHGSVRGQLHLPWYHKAGDVECFSAKDRLYRRPLGEDAYTYKLQLEDFARCILDGAPQHGANVDDGLAGVRAMAAIARSVETGAEIKLSEVEGCV